MAPSPSHAAVSPRSELSAGDLAEWMSVELSAYNVLQEVSAQIVSNCESFGKQLEGVCGQAIRKLPPAEGEAAFACSDACIGFISAFGTLSHELLQLAGDLECSLRKPLQGIIISLNEERSGRLRHWKQVRSRFAELQERYHRSQRRSIEARGKLEKKESSSSKGWLRRSKGDSGEKYANEQHEAMCDLAQCEEELRESEDTLRRLEEENKEMLRQLDREKQVVLRGALVKGTSSLRRLVSVADKALSVTGDADGAPESPASEGWAGVMPCSRRSLQDEVAGLEEAQADSAEEGSGLASPIVPAPAESEVVESPSASSNPSAKYVQGAGAPVALDISELSDSDEQDACVRAASWTLRKEPSFSSTPKRRSLVFQQSTSLLLTAESRSRSASSTAGASASPQEHPSALGLPSQLGRLAALRDDQDDGQLGAIAADPQATGSASPAATPTAGLSPPAPSGKTTAAAAAAPATALPPPSGKPTTAAVAAPVMAPPPPKASGPVVTSPNRRSGVEDSSDSDDDDEARPAATSKPAPKPPLEEAELKLDVLPLVADSDKAFQKCFERYVRRLPEDLAVAAETEWDKLQKRAGEQCLGGHVGKLEFFWICRPGSDITPDAADGLVCFQFVQGFAANFARVLHLSVAGQSGDSQNGWGSILPSAIFEVRRHIFEMLPVDSIRAVVLAGEDESGRIYVDTDVEAAYQRCRFRWFQLTQNLRRSRSGIRRKKKLKPSTRFLVLHASRQAFDPLAPKTSSIGRLPAVLFKDDPTSSSDSKIPAGDTQSPVEDGQAVETFTSEFSSW